MSHDFYLRLVEIGVIVTLTSVGAVLAAARNKLLRPWGAATVLLSVLSLAAWLAGRQEVATSLWQAWGASFWPLLALALLPSPGKGSAPAQSPSGKQAMAVSLIGLMAVLSGYLLKPLPNLGAPYSTSAYGAGLFVVGTAVYISLFIGSRGAPSDRAT